MRSISGSDDLDDCLDPGLDNDKAISSRSPGLPSFLPLTARLVASMNERTVSASLGDADLIHATTES